MSEAGLGYGGFFDWSTDGGTTWEPLAEVTTITPPAFAIDAIDVTHMQSPGAEREFIPGLIDPGECSIEQNFLPGSDSELFILGIKRQVGKGRIRWPNGAVWTFNGFLTGYAPAAPLDDKMTATTTFKVTSGVVSTPAP